MRSTIAVALFLILMPAAYGQSTVNAIDLTAQFANAGLPISSLRAAEIGGIVVLRGNTEDRAVAAAATRYARTLGYDRVANLIRIVDPPDDAKIERSAERRLATRVLDGCTFRLDSEHGVLTVAGKVKYELQKDVAMSILRNIDGVREVRASITR